MVLRSWIYLFSKLLTGFCTWLCTIFTSMAGRAAFWFLCCIPAQIKYFRFCLFTSRLNFAPTRYNMTWYSPVPQASFTPRPFSTQAKQLKHHPFLDTTTNTPKVYFFLRFWTKTLQIKKNAIIGAWKYRSRQLLTAIVIIFLSPLQTSKKKTSFTWNHQHLRHTVQGMFFRINFSLFFGRCVRSELTRGKREWYYSPLWLTLNNNSFRLLENACINQIFTLPITVIQFHILHSNVF